MATPRSAPPTMRRDEAGAVAKMVGDRLYRFWSGESGVEQTNTKTKDDNLKRIQSKLQQGHHAQYPESCVMSYVFIVMSYVLFIACFMCLYLGVLCVYFRLVSFGLF